MLSVMIDRAMAIKKFPMNSTMFKRGVIVSSISLFSAGASGADSPYKWKEFVQAKGHVNPIPKAWIATPEGRFAHDLKIPNPVPADAGYKKGMNPAEYYLHLCDKEAGEFIFKTADDVEGLYFARPPVDPTDDDLKDRWKLEHPWLESKFQLERMPKDRAVRFVSPPWRNYKFYEEPNQQRDAGLPYLRLSGFRHDMRDSQGNLISRGTPWQEELAAQLKSRYGMTWRGIHRPSDRENGIAGGEVIIYDLQTNEVLYVFRNYAFSGRTRGTPDGIWWLNSGGCQRVYMELDRIGFGFAPRAEKVLKLSK